MSEKKTTKKSTRRKGGGTIFMAVGLLLLIGALGLTIFNVWDDKRAGKAADEVAFQLESEIADLLENPDEHRFLSGQLDGSMEPDYVLTPDMEMPVVKVKDVWYQGLLKIPTLGLSLPVMEKWSMENLKNTPCRYAGSVYKDNMVIAGHNYSRHFHDLKYLDLGDAVQFMDGEGNVFNYQVDGIEILQPSQVEEMTTGDYWDLTLFTCTYGAGERVTVRCSRVDKADNANKADKADKK